MKLYHLTSRYPQKNIKLFDRVWNKNYWSFRTVINSNLDFDIIRVTDVQIYLSIEISIKRHIKLKFSLPVKIRGEYGLPVLSNRVKKFKEYAKMIAQKRQLKGETNKSARERATLASKINYSKVICTSEGFSKICLNRPS